MAETGGHENQSTRLKSAATMAQRDFRRAGLEEKHLKKARMAVRRNFPPVASAARFDGLPMEEFGKFLPYILSEKTE